MLIARCRMLWSISVFGVLALTFSNVLLTLRFLNAPTQCDDGMGMIMNAPQFPEPDSGITSVTGEQHRSTVNNLSRIKEELKQFRLRLSEGRWDSKLLYRINDFVIVANEQETGDAEVCLATQTSVDRLFWLPRIMEHWSGRVSLALFAPGEDWAIGSRFIAFLRVCFPDIMMKVSVHLLYPPSHPPVSDLYLQEHQETDCKFAESHLKRLLKLRKSSFTIWRGSIPYPQNHLRNVARKNCLGRRVFLTDVDIIPSMGMFENLSKFFRMGGVPAMCEKCAFVIPTYELTEVVSFPKNKTQLVDLVRRGQARPFHQRVFVHNQYATNFSRWEESTETSNVHVSHNVTNFEFFYEPFYVSLDTVPIHDERFIGYGFTRNSQVYEMFVAGFRFQVLTPVFTIHWGLQKKKGRPSWREKQNSLNRKLFDVFKREVTARYGKDPLHLVFPNRKPDNRYVKTKSKSKT